MLFNFAIETEHGWTTFGICTADDIDAAKKFISLETNGQAVNVEESAEAVAAE